MKRKVAVVLFIQPLTPVLICTYLLYHCAGRIALLRLSYVFKLRVRVLSWAVSNYSTLTPACLLWGHIFARQCTYSFCRALCVLRWHCNSVSRCSVLFASLSTTFSFEILSMSEEISATLCHIATPAGYINVLFVTHFKAHCTVIEVHQILQMQKLGHREYIPGGSQWSDSHVKCSALVPSFTQIAMSPTYFTARIPRIHLWNWIMFHYRNENNINFPIHIVIKYPC